MILDENQGASGEPQIPEGEGGAVEDEKVSISKKEYDNLNQALGSLKRELKDLKKPKEAPQESPQQAKPEESGLIQKTYLRAAGITHEEDVELALTTAKKWDMPIDKLVDDEDFLGKLEKARNARANADATSGIRGDKSASSAKNTPEYWIASGKPPTPEQVPDRKTRSKIVRSFMQNAKSTSKFYND